MLACDRTEHYVRSHALMTSLAEAKQLRDALRSLVVAHGVLDTGERPCGTPLNAPHAYALMELLEAPDGMTTTELSAKLSIDRTNVSRLVARMEANGEVRRRIDACDGRAKTVTLTAMGKRLAGQVDAASASHFAQLTTFLELPTKTVVDSLRALHKAMIAAPRIVDEQRLRKGI